MFDMAQAQRAMFGAVAPTARTEDVTVSKAVGRVLAEPLASLPAGTRLRSQHVPCLASAGRPTVRVFQRLRAGVLTLGDAAHASGPSRCTHALVGPTLASVLDGMGAVAIAAPQVIGDAAAAGSVLDMLLGECTLVVVCGCVTPTRHRQFQEALRARGASVEDWQLCDEFGASLSLANWGDKVIVCLPCGLAEAFRAFTLLVSPLIRRLQGRTELLPASHAANIRLDETTRLAERRFFWANEAELRSELSLLAHGPSNTIDAIARSDGIARVVSGSMEGEIAKARYYPFSTWLE